MLAQIIGIETIYNPPLGGVGVYRMTVAFTNRGSATFNQQFVVPPTVGQMWEMAEPRLESLKNYPDGSPR